METQDTHIRFAICMNDGGYVDDLKVRTVYQVLPDESAAKSHYIRIIDETGEDYIYPASYFVPIDVPDVEQIFKTPAHHAKIGRVQRKRRPLARKKPTVVVS